MPRASLCGDYPVLFRASFEAWEVDDLDLIGGGITIATNNTWDGLRSLRHNGIGEVRWLAALGQR